MRRWWVSPQEDISNFTRLRNFWIFGINCSVFANFYQTGFNGITTTFTRLADLFSRFEPTYRILDLAVDHPLSFLTCFPLRTILMHQYLSLIKSPKTKILFHLVIDIAHSKPHFKASTFADYKKSNKEEKNVD